MLEGERVQYLGNMGTLEFDATTRSTYVASKKLVLGTVVHPQYPHPTHSLHSCRGSAMGNTHWGSMRRRCTVAYRTNGALPRQSSNRNESDICLYGEMWIIVWLAFCWKPLERTFIPREQWSVSIVISQTDAIACKESPTSQNYTLLTTPKGYI